MNKKAAAKKVVTEKSCDDGFYTGPVENLANSPDGLGEMQLYNGDRYRGSFKVGLFCGQGVYECFSVPLQFSSMSPQDPSKLGDHENQRIGPSRSKDLAAFQSSHSPEGQHRQHRARLWTYTGHWDNGLRVGQGICRWFWSPALSAMSELATPGDRNCSSSDHVASDGAARSKDVVVLEYDGSWDNDCFDGKGELRGLDPSNGQALWSFRGVFKAGKPKFARAKFNVLPSAREDSSLSANDGRNDTKSSEAAEGAGTKSMIIDNRGRPQGCSFEGTFDEFYRLHGSATVIWPSIALKYVGSWQHGHMHGAGVLTSTSQVQDQSHDGLKLETVTKADHEISDSNEDSEPIAPLTATSSTSNTEEGRAIKMSWSSTGASFYGHLHNGEMHGRGVFVSPSSQNKNANSSLSLGHSLPPGCSTDRRRWSVYVGDFVNGVMQGRGTMIWDAGTDPKLREVAHPSAGKKLPPKHPLQRFELWAAEQWASSGSLPEFLKAFEAFHEAHRPILSNEKRHADRDTSRVISGQAFQEAAFSSSSYRTRINVYTGEFRCNAFHGQGVLDFHDGTRFRGWFESGRVAAGYEGFAQQFAHLSVTEKQETKYRNGGPGTGMPVAHQQLASQPRTKTPTNSKLGKKQQPLIRSDSKKAKRGLRKSSTSRTKPQAPRILPLGMQDKAGRLNDNKSNWIEVALTLRGNYGLVPVQQTLTEEDDGKDELQKSTPANDQPLEGYQSCVECGGASVFQLKSLPSQLAPSALGHESDKIHAQDLCESLSFEMCTVRGGTWRNGVLCHSQCQVQWPESGSSWGENEMITYDGMCDNSSICGKGRLAEGTNGSILAGVFSSPAVPSSDGVCHPNITINGPGVFHSHGSGREFLMGTEGRKTPAGCSYVGDFVHGRFHGHGVRFDWANRAFAAGSWDHGRLVRLAEFGFLDESSRGNSKPGTDDTAPRVEAHPFLTYASPKITSDAPAQVASEALMDPSTVVPKSTPNNKSQPKILVASNQQKISRHLSTDGRLYRQLQGRFVVAADTGLDKNNRSESENQTEAATVSSGAPKTRHAQTGSTRELSANSSNTGRSRRALRSGMSSQHVAEQQEADSHCDPARKTQQLIVFRNGDYYVGEVSQQSVLVAVEPRDEGIAVPLPGAHQQVCFDPDFVCPDWTREAEVLAEPQQQLSPRFRSKPDFALFPHGDGVLVVRGSSVQREIPVDGFVWGQWEQGRLVRVHTASTTSDSPKT